ncbi:MAG: ATP-binding protein, partial [Deltaproteobacteria bacterium]
MALDAWLPVGYKLPDGAKARVAAFEGANWQIYETHGEGRALVVHDELAHRWIDAGLIEPGLLTSFDLGDQHLWTISCGLAQVLCPVAEGNSPETKAEALSFALALKATRDIDTDSPLQDALYVEKISRLLPTYSISSRTDDDVVLGYWLTGGASVSAKSFRRLRQTMSWLGAGHLRDVVQAAGFEVAEVMPADRARVPSSRPNSDAAVLVDGKSSRVESESAVAAFELAGRPDLAAFFN